MSETREQFGSRIGFILAAAGSAVGIGNLVGFPVGAAKNGGGAFLVMYAIFVFAICLPVMLAEMSVGRHAKKDPLGAYNLIGQGALHWRLSGWLSIITPFMIAVFYLVITVWIFGYLFEIVSGNLDTLADGSTFGTFINSNAVFAYMALVLGVVYLILQGGVKQGIEKAAKRSATARPIPPPVPITKIAVCDVIKVSPYSGHNDVYRLTNRKWYICVLRT